MSSKPTTYAAAVLGIYAAFSGISWLGQRNIDRYNASFWHDLPPWAHNYDDSVEGQALPPIQMRMHDLCRAQMRGAAGESASNYSACYSAEMESRADTLCQADVKAQFLKILKYYADDVSARRQAAQNPEQPNSPFAGIEAKLRAAGTESSDIAIGNPDLPEYDSRVATSLSNLVARGALSPTADLQPVMDTSLLTITASDEDIATARRELCE